MAQNKTVDELINQLIAWMKEDDIEIKRYIVPLWVKQSRQDIENMSTCFWIMYPKRNVQVFVQKNKYVAIPGATTYSFYLNGMSNPDTKVEAEDVVTKPLGEKYFNAVDDKSVLSNGNKSLKRMNSIIDGE